MARLAKLSSKNQITIPKGVLDHYVGTEYFEVSDTGQGIYLEPVRTVKGKAGKDVLEEMRDKFKALGLTEKDIEDAVKWARKERKAGR